MNAAETAPMSGPNATRPRLLLEDDHPCILEKLRLVLGPHFEVVGTAEDGEEMLQSAVALQPDLIVADISMPGLTGIEATRH